MSAFLDIALACIARGWHVHPLKPRDKIPVTKHGMNDATLDEAQIRAWWTRNPNCNVGISCAPSGLCVLDADHGLKDEQDFAAWRDRNGLPVTYAVRSGRRPEFGVQSYYLGGLKEGKFELDGVRGDIKSAGGLVLAAGCIHPDSGETYYVLVDALLAPVPAIVDASRVRKPIPATLDGGDITENRNTAMASILGKLREAGLSDDLLRDYAIRTNEARMKPPLDEAELEHIVQNACKWPVPAPEAVAVFGTPEPSEPVDWRTRYLTFEQVRDAKPVEFLVQGFLALDSITAIAAPVGQRKSLIALNMAHALCTGEPLFDYFEVVKRPSRVVYLCPEMGLGEFSTRLKQIGLLDYVGKTLFCQTMNDESVSLSELQDELPGSVVIIDTLTRFVVGDQNSSQDMSKVATEVFRLKRAGATVVLLHHSIKGTSALTLDSAMRGSTELAAFLTCCWATKLTDDDPDQAYDSPSRLVNVKQRDFQAKAFDATCDKTCRMRIVGVPGSLAEIKGAKDKAAEDVLRDILSKTPDLGINKLRAALKAAGHSKGPKWVTMTRTAIAGTGVTLTSE